MNNRQIQNLVSKYPALFSQQLPFGIECGDGWYDILDQLMGLISSYIEFKNKKEIQVEPVIIVQIKEKFGTLRFYFDGGDERIYGMVRMAEAMSSITCEECGKPGKLRGTSWFYTSCDEHSREK